MPMPTEKLNAINNEPSLVAFLNPPLVYNQDITIDYYHAATLPPALESWTFELVKTNLYHLYVRSNDGWDEAGKKAELYAPEARYLIARSTTDPTDLKGFLMFQMVQEETMDDDYMADVAYCYELQVAENARNQGLGEHLMSLLCQIGHHWQLEKVMLTVFKDNKGAMRFYTKKMGFELDEISPGACLSPRKAKRFDYEILSKPC